MIKIIILMTFTTQTMASLQAEAVKTCMEKDYKVEITRKAFPFGLFEKKLTMTKSKCQIKIHHESYHWLKKGWEVDVCREPIHVKDGIYSLEVLKKTAPLPQSKL